MEEQFILKEKSCAFTGHRDLKSDFSLKKLEKEIVSLIKKGVDTFYCGMAVGFDLVVGKIVVSLKNEYPQIKLVACVPFNGQEKYYDGEDKERYYKILDFADEKVVLHETFKKYAYLQRNRYMVDRSNYLIAYLRENKGGTHQTVEYFKKKGEGEIIFI